MGTLLRMLDSANANNIPAGTKLMAGYVDGAWRSYFDMRIKFPNAFVVSITVAGQAGAMACDCETGDLTPSGSAEWAAREVQAGRKPTIYANGSTWPTVDNELAALGLERGKQVNGWLASYDGIPIVPPGFVAKQYSGGIYQPYDMSEVVPGWPIPITVPTEGVSNVELYTGPNGSGAFGCGWGLGHNNGGWHMLSSAEWSAVEALGWGRKELSQTDYDKVVSALRSANLLP